MSNPYYKHKKEDMPMTLQQVAEALGVSKQRILQIEKSAMEKLKTTFRANILKQFIDDNIIPTSEEIKALENMQLNRPLDMKKGGRAYDYR